MILGFLRGRPLLRFTSKGTGLVEDSLLAGSTLVLVKYGLTKVKRKVVLL